MSIAVVAFASPIHGEGYVKGRFLEVKSRIPEALGPFHNAEEAPELKPKALVAVTLTGGTSAAVVEYARRIGVRRVLAVGTHQHNGAASALSAKSLLESEGIRAWAFLGSPDRDLGSAVEVAKRVAEAVAVLTSPRVLLIGRRTAQADRFAAKFGGVVEVMGLDEFADLVERSKPDPRFVSTFGDEELSRIYSALKSLRGYDGIALTCFPFIMKRGLTPCLALSLMNSEGDLVACEGDLQALTAMIISRSLTGFSGWIANVVYARSEEAFFAHCTLALNMARTWRLMPHFETGRPYGLAATLAHREYTGVSVGPLFDKMAVGVST
ncbi:MAG: fucose isomerase [Thermoproteus sp.]